MNALENKIINLTEDLRKNYGATAIKADLSAEMTTFREMLKLREFASETDVAFCVKTGGCDALNDIFCAKEAQADCITAPMIETAYSAEKFAENVLKVYSEDELKDVLLRINIETAEAYRNIDEITARPETFIIGALVLGRDDMAASVHISKSEINSDIMLQAAKTLKSKAAAAHKEFVLGGEIRPQAASFIKTLMPDGFETRKVVFDMQTALASDMEKAIMKALELEILLLEFKSEFNEFTFRGMRERINSLNSYLEVPVPFSS